MIQTISITVTGKVQGVFFRQSTREKAMELGITGTVTNQPDGSVLVQATGSREQLDKLVDWCRQGPPRARVERCISAALPLKEFDRFTIVRN